MSEINLSHAFHSDPVIQIRDLCVDYITDNGDFNAVKSVSFDIGKAKYSALLGNLDAERVPSLFRSIVCTSRPRLSLADKFCSKVRTSYVCPIRS